MDCRYVPKLHLRDTRGGKDLQNKRCGEDVLKWVKSYLHKKKLMPNKSGNFP